MTDAPGAAMRPEPFENLDRIATVEMRMQGMPAGVVRRLYDAARTDGPLTQEVGQALLDCVDGRIAIVTGIILDELPQGEVDGPVGAAVLAQGLERLGASVDVIVPPEMIAPVEAIRDSLAAGFEIRSEARCADEYIAGVSIEKLGRNCEGAAHTVMGAPMTQDFAADDLIDALNAAGKLTIGIGDGGNEIGFGAIYEQARAIAPAGESCRCPCGGGIITVTATQILFPAAVSNYGAYAVTGALAVLAERPDVLPYPDAVGDAIVAAVEAGCIDGGTFRPGVVADDGVPLEAVKAIVSVMRTIVQQSFRWSPRHAEATR